MAKAVDRDVRQVVGADKVTESASDGVGMDRRSVRLGKQPITVDPAVAHTQATLSLPTFVFFEQLDGDCGRFDVAGWSLRSSWCQ